MKNKDWKYTRFYLSSLLHSELEQKEIVFDDREIYYSKNISILKDKIKEVLLEKEK